MGDPTSPALERHDTTEFLDLKKPVIGRDSEGTEIRLGDCLLTKNLGNVPASPRLLAMDFGSILLPSPGEAEQVLERVIEVHPHSRENMVNVRELLALSDEDWEDISNQLKDIANKNAEVQNPADAEGRNLDHIPRLNLPISSFEYISKASVKDGILHLDLFDVFDGTSSQLEIELSGEPRIFKFFGVPIVTQYIRAPGPDGLGEEEYIATGSIHVYAPHNVIIYPEKVVQDEADVVNALRKDFPWFEQEDLHNRFVKTMVKKDPQGQVPVTDQRRLAKARIPGSALNGHASEAEELYVAARNYCRLVEMATRVDSYIPGHSAQISSRNSRERLTLAIQFVAELEAATVELQEPIWELEKDLFGQTYGDILKQTIDRFAAKETTFSEASGVYYAGITALSTVLLDKIEPALLKLPESERHAKAIRIIAEVNSHENGHRGADDVLYAEAFGAPFGKVFRTDWPREEIWNETRSILWNRRLKNLEPDHLSIYHFHPRTDVRGGAYELMAMINQLADLSRRGTFKISIDESTYTLDQHSVFRSALATAITRTEKGHISLGIAQTIGFETLYEQVREQALRQGIQLQPYEERLEGCSDSDYRNKFTLAIEDPTRVKPNYNVEEMEELIEKVAKRKAVAALSSLEEPVI